MTPERAKELLPVIQAYADGKEVECRRPPHGSWAEVQHPLWANAIDYRVKPEVPQYRLFQYKNGPIVVVIKPSPFVNSTTRDATNGAGDWITEWVPCPNIKLD